MLEGFQIILNTLAMGGKKLSDPSSQVCSLGSKVTGLVSYLEEDNGFFWLQRNPEKVEELGESLESQVVDCVEEQKVKLLGSAIYNLECENRDCPCPPSWAIVFFSIIDKGLKY